MLKFGHYELCEEENHASPQASNRKFPEKKKNEKKNCEKYITKIEMTICSRSIYIPKSVFLFIYFLFSKKRQHSLCCLKPLITMLESHVLMWGTLLFWMSAISYLYFLNWKWSIHNIQKDKIVLCSITKFKSTTSNILDH